MSSHDKEALSTIDADHLPLSQQEAQSQRSKHEHRRNFSMCFPWLGLGSLLVALMMSITSVIVLWESGNKAASQWSRKIAPNVILTILNSCASVCYAVAVTQGVAISWWRKAAKGTTIQDLSRLWAFGYDFTAILFQARHFNLVALAAIVAKVSIIDGILFQRATTAYVALGPENPRNLTTFPTNEFPSTGLYDANPSTPKFLDSLFIFDVSTWLRSGSDSIDSTYGFGDCEGICSVRYPGPGFAISCSSSTEEVDLIANQTGSVGINHTASSSTVRLFEVNFNYTFATAERNYSWIGLNMTSYNTHDQSEGTYCPATLLLQQCELRPAILSYPVVSEVTNVATKSQRGNDTGQSSVVNVYLGQLNETDGSWEGTPDFDTQLDQASGFDILSYINLTGQPSPYGYTLVGGIMLAMQDLYGSQMSVTISSNDSTAWYLENQGLFAGLSIDAFSPSQSNISCPLRTVNPFSNIYTYLNKLTFIMADDLYNRPAYRELINGTNATQEQLDAYYNSVRDSTRGVQYTAEVHYKTDYGFMFGALASTLICVVFVLPSYWGFWELDRKVSLNPIETAQAFGAPTLADARIRSGHAKEVVAVAGSQNVRYVEHESQGWVIQRVRG